jgi:Na+-translocating ferredoxin:NAD+ oxidoreductase RnfE subunit
MIRIAAFIVVIAGFVTAVDCCAGFLPGWPETGRVHLISRQLHHPGRAEAFATRRVLASAVDASARARLYRCLIVMCVHPEFWAAAASGGGISMRRRHQIFPDFGAIC